MGGTRAAGGPHTHTQTGGTVPGSIGYARAMRYLTLLAVLCGGCGSVRVSGTVDDRAIGGARDAIFDQVSVDVPFLGTYEATVLILTDFPDACEVLEDLYTVVVPGCEARCDDYLDLVELHNLTQDEAWSLGLVLNTSDEDTDFTLSNDLQAGTFTAGFTHYDTAPLLDEALCVETCQEHDLLDGEYSSGRSGTLELTDQDDEQLRGSFELSLQDDDTLQGSFRASRCDMEQWLWFL